MFVWAIPALKTSEQTDSDNKMNSKVTHIFLLSDFLYPSQFQIEFSYLDAQGCVLSGRDEKRSIDQGIPNIKLN